MSINLKTLTIIVITEIKVQLYADNTNKSTYLFIKKLVKELLNTIRIIKHEYFLIGQAAHGYTVLAKVLGHMHA